MTDQELLEKAAKVAGIDGWYVDDNNELYGRGILFNNINDCLSCWNPIDDDADAFRLMVEFHLCASVNADYVYVCDDFGGLFEEFISQEIDIYEATRKAIVRAVASRK